MLIGGGSGADGIGFSFGTPPGEAFADFGYLTSHNLTVNFNTFGGDGDGPWIYAFATPGGGQINSNINPRTSPARYVPVIVTWQNDRLSVRYDGIDVFPGGVALSGWNALVGDKFGFGGRIGGLWDNHFIDDVSVSTVTTPDATGTPDLLAASDTGVSNTDNITKASSLTFSVPTAETGALVELLRDDVVVASRTGSGELTDPMPTEGSHSYTARQTVNLFVSPPTSPLIVSVDRTAPTTPGLPGLQVGSDSGISSTDNLTNDNTPTFAVLSTDSYFRVQRGGIQIGGDYETGSEYTTALQADGTYAYALRAVDAAGNVSEASLTHSVTIDTVAPDVPGTPDLQAGSDSGISNSDNLTNDSTPTLDLPSTGAYYRLTRDGTPVTGDFATGAYTSALLADGTYAFVARSVDAAGNVSAVGQALNMTIDTVAPGTPPAPDLQAMSDSGVSNTDNVTNDSTPTFDITSTPFFRIERNGFGISGDYETGTSYAAPAQPDGTHAFAARAVDAAGNASAPGPVLEVTIDTTGPAVTTKQFFFEVGHSVQYIFGEEVAPTLVNGDLVLENVSLGTIITTSMSYAGTTATFTFPSFAAGLLRDANYRATIASPNVTDVAGNPPTGDEVLDFFVLAGDASRDRAVNLDDFTPLANNFGRVGRVFSQGDFDYSGAVDLEDFNILAIQFGNSLPPTSRLLRTSTKITRDNSLLRPDSRAVGAIRGEVSQALNYRLLFSRVAVAAWPDEGKLSQWDNDPLFA